jgi:hypothetical protein
MKFIYFTSVYINESNININYRFKCNNALDMNKIFLNQEQNQNINRTRT